jgi:tetratricopeptide (TPR) repeat protein
LNDPDAVGDAPDLTITVPSIEPDQTARMIGIEKIQFDLNLSLWRLSRRTPLLMVIEDLQWADQASLVMLDYLSKRAVLTKCSFIITYRPGQTEGTDPDYLELVKSITGTVYGHRIILRMLDSYDTSLVIREHYPSPSTMIDQTIYAMGGGNPLFTIELCNLLKHDLETVLDGSKPEEGIENTLPIGNTIQGIILSRISSLPPLEKRTLAFISILGSHCTADNLSACLGIEGKTLEHIYLDMVDRNIFIDYLEGHIRFTHHLISEIIYDNIDGEERTSMHRVCGETLEKLGLSSIYDGDLAWHFYKGNDCKKAVNYSLAAGRSCFSVFAARDSIIYFEIAAECLELQRSNERDWIAAMEGLGDAYEELEELEMAWASYSRILNLEHLDQQTRARILRKGSDCHNPSGLGKGDISIMRRLVEEALEIESDDLREKGELFSSAAILYFKMGEYERAVDFNKEAISIFRQCGCQPRLGWELSNYAFMLINGGEASGSLQILYEALEIYSQYQWVRGEAIASNTLGEAYLHLGWMDVAMDCFERSEQLSQQIEQFYELSWAHFYKSLVLELMDDHDGSYREGQKSVYYALRSSSKNLPALGHIISSKSLMNMGEKARAIEEIMAAELIVSRASVRTNTPLWGLFSFVKGESLVLYEEISNGLAMIEKGLIELRTVQYGQLYMSICLYWYSGLLRSIGFVEKAIAIEGDAISLFKKLNNYYFLNKMLL